MINEIIKKYWKDKGGTFEDLAEKLDMDKLTLYRKRVGKSGISPDELKRLSEVLGVSIHEIVTGTPFKGSSKVEGKIDSLKKLLEELEKIDC